MVLKARGLAERINEPYDPAVVSSLITFINIYGLEAVTGAVDKATRLSFANGKWEIRYIAGILRTNIEAFIKEITRFISKEGP